MLYWPNGYFEGARRRQSALRHPHRHQVGSTSPVGQWASDTARERGVVLLLGLIDVYQREEVSYVYQRSLSVTPVLLFYIKALGPLRKFQATTADRCTDMVHVVNTSLNVSYATAKHKVMSVFRMYNDRELITTTLGSS